MPLPPSSVGNRVYEVYHAVLSRLIGFFNNHGLNGACTVLGTLLLEPHHAFRAGLDYFTGKKREFHYYGLNPASLTPEQAIKNPILLLHGSLHNQSAWLKLAEKLQQTALGPIYTLNLPHGYIGSEDYVRLEQKAKENSGPV